MLKKAAVFALCRGFSSVAVGEDWLSIPYSLVHALLSDDRLRVESEEDVYHAAIAWLRAREPPEDAEKAVDLLSLIRYGHVSPAFMRDVMTKEPLLMSPPGSTMITTAFAGVLESGVAHRPARHRGGLMLLAIGGFGGNFFDET